MYLDLDVILAELKADDWLASDVDIESIEEPKTSVATNIELQYVVEDEWKRDRVVRVHREIRDTNIELVPLTSETLDAAADLRAQYEALNVFDGVHLGSTTVLDEPIVSTDMLFPEIPEIDHADIESNPIVSNKRDSVATLLSGSFYMALLEPTLIRN